MFDQLTDASIVASSEFHRVWRGCVLADEDAAAHDAWQREMKEAESTLGDIVPTTIAGVAAILGVVRLRTAGCMPDELDGALLANAEVALRNLSAA